MSGFKVFPNEVEDVLTTHPGVLEAGCIGVPDARSGEAVKASSSAKGPGAHRGRVLEHCREYLTGYKVPKYVEFRRAAAENEHRQDPAAATADRGHRRKGTVAA